MILRLCRNCEFYDDGTGSARTAALGDCHNRFAPRFTTKPDDTCPEFMIDTTLKLNVPRGHEQ